MSNIRPDSPRTHTETEQSRTDVHALRRPRMYACGIVRVRRVIEIMPAALGCGNGHATLVRAATSPTKKVMRDTVTNSTTRPGETSPFTPPKQRATPTSLIKGLLQTAAPVHRTYRLSSPPLPRNRTTTHVRLWAVETQRLEVIYVTLLSRRKN